MAKSQGQRFVALARVSSREQEREGFSLDVQEEALRQFADRVGGEIVRLFRIAETASTVDLFCDARHPYSQGLIDSIPTILGEKDDMRARLKGISGSPPPLVNPPKGCRFHPRCKFAKDKCGKEMPEPFEVAHDHLVSCFKAEEESKGHEW